MPKKKSKLGKHRQRRFMVPADEKAWVLVEQLLGSKNYTVQEVIRILGRRGYDVPRATVYERKTRLGLLGFLKKNAKAKESGKVEMQKAILRFKSLDEGPRLVRLDRLLEISSELN